MLGECDLTAFLLPYPTLLYNLTYLGLFLMTSPFLRFGLVILNPRNRLSIQIMLTVHTVSVAAVLLLQLSGRMDFIKSLYWFHAIAPLGFVVFAGSLIWEHFRHHNPTAGRFAPTVIMMAAASVLEVTNYWLNLGVMLTVFFQISLLLFILSLVIVSGSYVRQSLQMAAEKSRLEYEMAATTRQLTLQRQQYRKLEENAAAVKAQRHDIRHHLAVLRELNEQGDSEKLCGYIDTLARKVPADKELRLCENYAVNAVAAHYAAAAIAQHIQTDLRLAIPGELDQALESDLCVVVGNLLENAVEACKRMTEGERFIRLNSRLEYGTLTLTADNSFGGQVREQTGVFLSSKREGAGLGLSSVRAVAHRVSQGRGC